MTLPRRRPQAVYRVYAEDDFLASEPDDVHGNHPDGGRGEPEDVSGGYPAGGRGEPEEPIAVTAQVGPAVPPPDSSVDAFTDEEVVALLAALDGSTVGDPGVDERSRTGVRGLTGRWPAVAALALMLALAACLALVVVSGLRSTVRSPSGSPPAATATPAGRRLTGAVPAFVGQRLSPITPVAARHPPIGRGPHGSPAHPPGRARAAATRVWRQSARAHAAAPSSAPSMPHPESVEAAQPAPAVPSVVSAQPAQPAPARQPQSRPTVVSPAHAPGSRPAVVQQFGFER